MFSRKKILWDPNTPLPRRTRHRKKTKLYKCSSVKESSPIGNNNAELTESSPVENIFDIKGNLDDPIDILHLQKQDDHFDKSIYENSKISLKSSLLLIMAFCLKFHITNDGLDHLLNLIYLHMPNSQLFPKTKYHFFQNFKAFSKEVKLYVPCSNCDDMLSDSINFEKKEIKNIVCQNCGQNSAYGRFNVENKYFLIFDIKTQLTNILNDSLVQKHIFKSQCESGHYSDITSGQFYSSLDKNKHDITLSLNTDGVPLFKSSSSTIWPIQLVINELPYSIRRKHIILGGLWLGTHSPETEYFEKFIENFNLMSESFNWNWNGIGIKSNVYTVLCTCDSVARCKLQNIVQFNGYNGCSWCEKRGVSVEKGRGRMMSYAEDKSASELSNLRTLESVYNAAKLAVEREKPVCGIKGPSCLSPLKNFDVVKSFVVDYMHCICLGIVRSITMLWLNSTQQDSFHINDVQKKLLSEKLSVVKTPSIIRRKPRAFNCIKYWKATEYLYWLLFYSPIFLKHILPLKFYNHWLLLVSSMHHLLDTHITKDQLNIVEYLLTKFVIDTSELYGPDNVTYNIHMLLHIPECVRNWGMVWNYSNFSFESFNGTLKKFVYGSQKAGYQIAQRFLTYQFVRNYYLMNCMEHTPDKNLLDSLVHGFRFNQNCETIIFGKSKCLENSPLLSLFKNRKYSKIYSFKNVVFKGIRFIPKGNEHVNNKRSANFILFNNNNMCAILFQLVSFKKIPSLNDMYCIVKKVQYSQNPFFKVKENKYLFNNIITVESINQNLTVWHLQDIMKIGIYFNGKTDFIVCIPGSLEKD